ncbi:Hypothetical predicted protein [Xyrichtys novacula]|uniref:Uncharacterized protein n=1 Tax=Xyrichtys novacula TaxID=13765 RepID=A0AAV1H1P3_XYRNO|nr:Hypothetical predicted protein [Xyrichtys novacula]
MRRSLRLKDRKEEMLVKAEPSNGSGGEELLKLTEPRRKTHTRSPKQKFEEEEKEEEEERAEGKPAETGMMVPSAAFSSTNSYG